jgi:hypothetical protein
MQSSYPFLSVDYYSELADSRVFKLGDKISGNIIFIKTELLNNYIPELLLLNHIFTLITACNDDMCVPYFTYPPQDLKIKELHDSLLNCPLLNKWYTKNASILHPKVNALPLGPKMQWRTAEFYGEPKYHTLELYNKYYLHPKDNFKSEKRNLLYINMDNTTTNTPFFKEHTGIRNSSIILLKNNGFIIQEKTSPENYACELLTYKFCISPPGRGIDAHRTWEAIMAGVIPICISSPLDYIYRNLPVLIVDNYSIITPSFLDEKYKVLRSYDYDYSIIYGDYWKNIIRSSNLV